MRRSAFFLPARSGGKRFCVLSSPEGAARGGIVYIHPFAEEMNKSRRMAALAAEAFTREGWAVLQIDLHGCGDSSGDFGDASWEDWLDDVTLAHDWLCRSVDGPVNVWALRAGALIVADWLQARSTSSVVLLWQPVVSGRQHVNQFLRVRAASKMLEDNDVRSEIAVMRAELKAGRSVEVAGYMLTGALASTLECMNVDLSKAGCSRVVVFELSLAENPEISPALANAVTRWRDSGVDVIVDALRGPAFWQTQEIETAPLLIERSLAAFSG